MDLKGLFANTKEIEKRAAGETIFSAGEDAHHMYVVLDGVIELRLWNQVINTIGEGDILGELALVGNRKRSATAIAKTDCTLTPINERRFTFLVQETPIFAIEVMRILAGRLLRKERQGVEEA